MTSQELKQIRLAMNLYQKELAKLLHVNYMTISRWECGYWPIPEDKAELLGYKWKEHNNKPYVITKEMCSDLDLEVFKNNKSAIELRKNKS